MVFFPPPRNLKPELLDEDQASFEEVKDSLEDVRRVNQYISGYRVLKHHLKPFLLSHQEDRPFTLLDLATGSADQPACAIRLARELKIPITVVAIDINRKMLRFAEEESARYPELKLVQCDIHNLPFKENAFDLVMNNLSLHHFKREEAVRILRVAHHVGRRGFIINDLHRSRVAYASIYLLTRIFTKNRLTRYDAPVSVMNAFTPMEMTAMTREAGVSNFTVERHFPYRIALVGKKEA